METTRQRPGPKSSAVFSRRVAPFAPLAIALATSALSPSGSAPATRENTAVTAAASDAPTPLLSQGHRVDWWFAFKFNTASFPGCEGGVQCPFGGEPKTYASSQEFAYATNEEPSLQMSSTCIGDTMEDPVGATFDEVYNGSFYYVVWNDQFYKDPPIAGCSTSCSSPWGHSKGLLAWNDDGSGLVMQVTTPSWPGAGGSGNPRKTDGNTLGCVDDDNVLVSQHFFALALTEADVLAVLRGLQNASVVTDPSNPQLVKNGGPQDIQNLVSGLGRKVLSDDATKVTLSSGVTLISKPSALHVPPWQMVSSLLPAEGNVGSSLRVATWWANPTIPSTTTAGAPQCWSSSLGEPGPVDIATSGHWEGKEIGLKGGLGKDFNHAKIGVSTSSGPHLAIFGDMNQQGALSGNCGSSQNGRGGLFYVVANAELADSVAALIAGDSAPAE